MQSIAEHDARMRRLLQETRDELERIVPTLKKPSVNERDQLQPCCARAAKRLAPEWSATVSTSTKAKHARWPRLGNIDITFDWGSGRPTYVELKCESGQGKHALCACAWDAVKLAFTQVVGDAALGYLIAGLPTAEWDAGQRGTQLFENRDWHASELRELFLDWWRKWEKEDYWPRLVPSRLTTSSVDTADLSIGGVPWQLRLARVDTGELWSEWPTTLAPS